MFLCLGGSRRSISGVVAQGHGQDFDQGGGDRGVDRLQRVSSQEDPLQALATGKYAPFRIGGLPPFQSKLIRSASLPQDAMLTPPAISAAFGVTNSVSYTSLGSFPGFGSGSGSGSPRSTLLPFVSSSSLPSLSRETRLSGESVALHGTGGEEVLSRDCTRLEQQQSGLRPSQALVLAKKLRDSLGHKFADSLRETIKEVAKRERVEEVKQDGGDAAWSSLPQSLEDISVSTAGLSRSESCMSGKSWDGCWAGETNGRGDGGIGTNSDHSNACASLLGSSSSFGDGALTALETPEDSLPGSSFVATADHSKVLSWLPQQQSLAQSSQERSAKAETPTSVLLGAPRYGWDIDPRAQDPHFFPPEHFSLLDTNEGELRLNRVFRESGLKRDWEGRSIEPRPPSTRAGTLRKHMFPEAAAMGTCLLDSARNTSFRPRVEAFAAMGMGRAKPRDGGDLYSSISKGDAEESLLNIWKGFQNNSNSLNPPSAVPIRDAKAEGLRKLSCRPRPSNLTVQEDVRQRLYESCEWQRGYEETGNVSTGYDGAALMRLSGFDLQNSPHRDASASAQFSKRRCVGSRLLDIPPSFDDDGVAVKADSAFGFEQYLAALTASERVSSSYELANPPLSKLLEDFSHESILPHASSS